ncbi:hypothetical protein [Micromonospora craniellae]|uniref:Uncharacterized protein n=1 Tax=Micromonospora craniellae TaxID=2294034 RepID=A0A372G6C0_9ACTN|nr:hypothetical protein [Micromonospora craniellae]QOC90323.1 hypothetical protein ID554_19315 [Micromonospora craniellae]RFS48538.1 hypothetical protein D0Q02_02025 [Micromonospora craniellae]
MAHRTLSRLLLTAFGVSLLAAAGQLGVAFGFGIIRLTGAFTDATVNQWPAQLVWAGWFAANAAVVGAVLTERLAGRAGGLTGTGHQVAVAGSAALGATVVAPLCMRPARGAELVSVDPVWAVAICAVLGAVVGAGAALAALIRPSFAGNMAGVAATMWLLALLSVAPALGASGPLTPVRLGVLEPTWLTADAAQRLALLLLPLISLLAGAATGALARWRGQPPLVSGPSGVAGPILVAFAYLAAGPGDASDRYQIAPYYGALIAVAVGVLGSAAAALVPLAVLDRGTAGTTETAIEPTAILPPLPATPALPTAAGRPAGPEPAAAGTVVVADPPGGTPTGPDLSATGAHASPPHWDWPGEPTAPGAPGRPPIDPASGTTPGTGTGIPIAAGPTIDGETAPAPTAVAPSADTASVGTASADSPTADLDAASTADLDAAGTADLDAAGTAPVGDGGDFTPASSTAEPAPASRRGRATRPSAQVRNRAAPAPNRATPAPTGPTGRPEAPSPTAGQSPTERTPTPRSGMPSASGTGSADRPGTAAVAPAADLGPAPVVDAPAADDVPTSVGPPDGATTPAAGPVEGPTPETATWHQRLRPAVHTTATWNAFAPTRRPEPADEANPPTQPGDATSPTEPADRVTPSTEPGDVGASSPDGGTDRTDSRTAGAEPDPAAAARDISAAFASAEPVVSTDPAAAARDLSAAFSKPPAPRAEPAPPEHDREKGRRGLFRRSRPRHAEPDTAEQEEPLAAQDEEYMDWVAGLGRPSVDDEPLLKEPRRRLRPTGRHHRE